MTPLRTDIHNWQYHAMIGVGGIGSGMFFALNNNHTLGREESRNGHFLDQKDYCKLHIISHYVKVLMGPKFVTIPLGKVGGDEIGARLIHEMKEIGLETHRVGICKNAQTLFSFCFLYPDGTGGNLTTDNSACDLVDADYVAGAESDFRRFSNSCIALAVPEVTLRTREKILDMGTTHHMFRVASFSSGEMSDVIQMKILQKCDLLAINMDEIAKASNMDIDPDNMDDSVKAAVDRITKYNPKLVLSITGGRQGSWFWDGQNLDYRHSINVEAVNTAGAGDAHLSGILVGLITGMTFTESHELGVLVSALSVTSPHTINKNINKDSLRSFVQRQKIPLSKSIKGLLR